MKKIRYLDLFAGSGGLSEGFIRAGFEPIAHVEIDRAACFTLKTRMVYHWLNARGLLDKYYAYLAGSLTRAELYEIVPKRQVECVLNFGIDAETLPEIFRQTDDLLNGELLDLIIGGPPCQAYSLIGRSRDRNRMKGDKRNYLYTYYAEFLKRYEPRFFIFENVMGLLSAKDAGGNLYFDAMRGLFREAGYETRFMILSADQYGVLQSRKRIILVGKRGSDTAFYPEPQVWNPGASVGDALQDLPSIRAGGGGVRPCHLDACSGQYLRLAGIRNDNAPVTWHWARPHTEQDLEIYLIAVEKWNQSKVRLNYNDLPVRLKTHQNCSSFLDRFKVVAANLPYSQTIVAHIEKDGHYYIHPDAHQNRSLTPREAARLQTFPDNYFFESVSGVPARSPVFRQIGNAVPVLFAQRIAEKLMEIW